MSALATHQVVAKGANARLGGQRRSLREYAVDALLVVGLAAATFFVHPVGYLLHHPYWADEGWVATLSRAPLREYFTLSSSTPPGWLLLVRWAPLGDDALRLVPLLFAAGSVVLAYVFARTLPWGSELAARGAGFAAGAVVLLAPISLVRHDLKQYTSDAFFALVLFVLAARLEAGWSIRRLAVFSIVAVVVLPFSTTTTFVSVALFGGLLVAGLVARDWDRVRAVLLAGAGTGVAVGLYVGLAVVPYVNPALRGYWASMYLAGSPGHMLGEAWRRLRLHAHPLGMHELVFVALLVVGVVALTRMRRPGTALAVPILWGVMFVAGAADRYPFLDQRTSHFLLIVSLAVVAIGFTGCIVFLATKSQTIAVVACVVAAIAFVSGTRHYVRERGIPNEDLRSQVRYVAEHRAPSDVVVVSYMSNYGFAYDWPGADVDYRDDPISTNGFLTSVKNVPNLVELSDRTDEATLEGMQRAVELARAAAAGASPGRIWVLRTHLSPLEDVAWTNALDALGLEPEVVPVGPEALWRIDGVVSE
jgi:hypothetical protein